MALHILRQEYQRIFRTGALKVLCTQASDNIYFGLCFSILERDNEHAKTCFSGLACTPHDSDSNKVTQLYQVSKERVHSPIELHLQQYSPDYLAPSDVLTPDEQGLFIPALAQQMKVGPTGDKEGIVFLPFKLVLSITPCAFTYFLLDFLAPDPE